MGWLHDDTDLSRLGTKCDGFFVPRFSRFTRQKPKLVPTSPLFLGQSPYSKCNKNRPQKRSSGGCVRQSTSSFNALPGLLTLKSKIL
jgi:hypothetical protein